jgi:hypothetical protein
MSSLGTFDFFENFSLCVFSPRGSSEGDRTKGIERKRSNERDRTKGLGGDRTKGLGRGLGGDRFFENFFLLRVLLRVESIEKNIL